QIEQLIRHDPDTKATFKALRKDCLRRWKNTGFDKKLGKEKYSRAKFAATTELGEALYYSTFETLMRKKPDRWPPVLKVLRNGLDVEKIFDELLGWDDEFREKFELR